MNTSNTSTPYFLTADHCLDAGNVSNWVFQFQYWGASCSSNAGYREDIQFNGCNLRANDATTDFALLELNNTPLPNSRLRYSGWDRSTGISNGSVGIHHPAGDLMKFCKDFDNVSESSWGGSNNHWVSIFELGTVQPGSSGSPLYNMNNRIIGQLHGDQQNSGNYCLQRRGEYGKFNASWTGGGTPSTRLSDWLDPSKSGAMITNTTNIACLNNFASTISGSNTICRGGAGYYTISSIPVGATITWQVAGGLTIISGQGTSTILISTQNAGGAATIQATITNCGASYTTSAVSVLVTFPPSMGLSYTYNNGTNIPQLLLYAPFGTPTNICLGYTSSGYLVAGVSSGSVTFTAISGATTSYRDNRSAWLNISPGAVGIVQVTATNNCGTETQTVAFKITNCGTPNNPSDPTNPPNPCNGAPKLYNISPNPAKEQIKIGISEKPVPIECPNNPYPPKMQLMLDSKEGITFGEVNIYNSFGILVLSRQTSKAKEFVIPLNELKTGLYLVQIGEGEYIERHQIIIE